MPLPTRSRRAGGASSPPGAGSKLLLDPLQYAHSKVRQALSESPLWDPLSDALDELGLGLELSEASLLLFIIAARSGSYFCFS